MNQPKYVIFVDNQVQGYLNDEESTKKAVSNICEKLTENIKENSSQIRVFTEKTDQCIKICTWIDTYTSFFSVSMKVKHTIEWKVIEEYLFN